MRPSRVAVSYEQVEMLLKCKGLVIAEALRVWSRLPKQTRAWIELDDLISQGMMYVWRKIAACDGHLVGEHRKAKHHRWKAGRGASASTYVSNFLYYDFDNDVVARYQDAISRCEKNVVSIDEMQQRARQEEPGSWAFEAYMAEKPKSPVMDCVIADAVIKVYNAASEELKAEMVRWFIENDKTKIHTSGERFEKSKREFRVLAAMHNINIEDCRHLVRSPVCLDIFSRKARLIPYNMNDPTPGIAVNLYKCTAAAAGHA